MSSIIIDTREQKVGDEVQEHFQKAGHMVERKGIKTGDYQWTGSDAQLYTVERKTGQDLLGSLASKRLWKQADRLAELPNSWIAIYDPPARLLDGRVYLPDNDRVTNWRWESVQRALCRLELMGIHVVQYQSKGDWLAWLLRLFEVSKKEVKRAA